MILSRKELNKIVTDSFGIKASEMVLITGPAKWMRAVAAECREVGALPLFYQPSLQSGRVRAPTSLQSKFQSVTTDQLLAITEEINAWVQILFHLHVEQGQTRHVRNLKQI